MINLSKFIIAVGTIALLMQFIDLPVDWDAAYMSLKLICTGIVIFEISKATVPSKTIELNKGFVLFAIVVSCLGLWFLFLCLIHMVTKPHPFPEWNDAVNDLIISLSMLTLLRIARFINEN